ncbi:hypothetical protein GJ496_000664 [Pomphorhynchus laevis]|nr:hypothetical protein GJ496_000664 [Pomphorhynchus laevis]
MHSSTIIDTTLQDMQADSNENICSYLAVTLTSKVMSHANLETMFDEYIQKNEFTICWLSKIEFTTIDDCLNVLEVELILDGNRRDINDLMNLDKLKVDNCDIKIDLLGTDQYTVSHHAHHDDHQDSDNISNEMEILNGALSTQEPKLLDYCQIHSLTKHCDPNLGFALVFTNDFSVFIANVLKILDSHNGSLPLATFHVCYKVVIGTDLEISEEKGLPLEYLLCCIDGVKIYTKESLNAYSSPHQQQRCQCKWIGLETYEVRDDSGSNSDTGNSDNSQLTNECEGSKISLRSLAYEVTKVIESSPKFLVDLSKLCDIYDSTFGPCKYMCPYMYGEKSLVDLVNRLASVCLVMGEGDRKMLTLQPYVQKKRFLYELGKLFSANCTQHSVPATFDHKIIESLLNINPSGLACAMRFGMFTVKDLVNLVADCKDFVKIYNINKCGIISRKATVTLSNEQLEVLNSFREDIKELLSLSENFSMAFHQFVPAFHHHTRHQCRVESYGFSKLIDLLNAVRDVVTVSYDNINSSKHIRLTQFALEQIGSKQVEHLFLNSKQSSIYIDQVFCNVSALQKFLELSHSSAEVSLVEFRKQKENALLRSSPFIRTVDSSGLVNFDSVGFQAHCSLASTVLQTIVTRHDIDHIRKLINTSCKIDVNQFIKRFLSKYLRFRENTKSTIQTASAVKVVNQQHQQNPRCGGDLYSLQLTPMCTFVTQLCYIMNCCKGEYITMDELNNMYFNKFRYRIRPQKYGYLHLDRMLSEIPEVVNLKYNGHQYFIMLKDGFFVSSLDCISKM